MNTVLLKKLNGIISAITNGDYSQGKKIDNVLRDKALQAEDAVFVESLGLMTVKLEANELALKNTIDDLRTRNMDLAELIKNLELFSTIFVGLFISISLYIFLLFIANNLHFKSDYFPRIVELLFFITCFVIVKKSNFPLTFFGFTLHGAIKSIKSMLPSTIVICTIMIVIKYLCIQNDVKGLDGALFYSQYFNMLILLYLPVVIVQDFLSKGVIQTVIEHVLVGRHARSWSIITASALFGLVHIQLSVEIAIASFLFGIYWGVVYVKSRTLIGVSISHFLIGNLAYLLGFWNYFLKA
ncbi:MAG: CPBP family intramembrane metalloprotease [Deltaproteobacteria bacterium]|nr:CPBP family intramembrane metalloprotease [Deltaproteobacteria bacterium]